MSVKPDSLCLEVNRSMIAPDDELPIAPVDRKLPKVEVTGVTVTALQLIEQVETMTTWAKQRLSKVVCVANVHMLMESRSDRQLSMVLKRADLVTPDGMPLVWMMRALGVPTQERVAGIDIFESACKRCSDEGISIYLIGSTQGVLHKMVMRLNRDFPNLIIAGVESPPFRPLTDAEDAEMIERVNSSEAGLTFVSLGCPKQEHWMANHYGKIQSVMVGVGGVFPVYAQIQRHAPAWIRQNGLEWLYRLVQEPRRLFGRYLKTIPPFICLAIRQVSWERKLLRRSPL